MTAEYEITKDDLSAFNLYHNLNSPTVRREYYRLWFGPATFWFLFCTLIWFLANRGRGKPLQTFLSLLPLFVGIPFHLLYFPWAYRRKVRKMIAGVISEGGNRSLFCRHRVAISPDGISDSGEFGHASTDWRAIERVVQDVDHAFVYTNALAAIIVPRRAFSVPSEFEEFVRAATDFHEKARD